MVDDRDDRPDPDALLASLKAEETRATRARLKIFFGAAPGVGKTYAMLQEARRAPAESRADRCRRDARPPRDRGAARRPSDSAAPDRRAPRRAADRNSTSTRRSRASRALILVDELAHTNAPGSKHVKRWQDVLDLLDAGIDVHTTINVQHIESLGDVIQQITGVRVRETVPDALIERADEIELVDISPDELLERLAEGKVYVPEQAQRAVQNFFQKGNLHALRELALRRTAERVDAEVLAYRKEHGISSPWPTSRAHPRVRRTEPWLGAPDPSDQADRGGPARTVGRRACRGARRAAAGEKDRERVESHLRLVEALGGDVVRLAGATVAGALLDHARETNVTRIVAGKPTHPRWRDLVRGSLLDSLIRGSGSIEMHVIARRRSGTAAAGVADPARAGNRDARTGGRCSRSRPRQRRAWCWRRTRRSPRSRWCT